MSTKISDTLSAGNIVQYHLERSAANYSAAYYSQTGRAEGVWFGRQCEALGLTPGEAALDEHIGRLANGQEPWTGEQLIAWKRPSEAEPAWARGDQAWSNHVDALVADGLPRIFAAWEGSGHEAASRGKAGHGPTVEPAAVVRTARESALLEMHAIARQSFIDNLTSVQGDGARAYLESRGIRMETASVFGVGLADGSLTEKLAHYGPELMRESGLFVERQDGTFYDRFRDRLMFPIENEAGETIAFGGRRSPTDSHSPKYVNSRATEIYQKGATVYNLHRASEAMAKSNQAVLVEGCLDVLAAHQAGQRNVVAPCGTSFTRAQAGALKERVETLVVNFDEDEAGRAGTERAVKTALDAGLLPRVVSLEQDPADWIQSHKVTQYREAIKQATPLVEYWVTQARARYGVDDLDEKLDALRWLRSSLAEVPPGMREEVATALGQYLGREPEAKPESNVLEHRGGWDVTFGAPKGYSVSALVGGDQRLVAAHDEAVREALAYGERAIQVKMGGLNAPETSGKMVAVLFRHDTARPVNGYAAAHLHTHCVIFNLSQDATGQFRALNPVELFRLQSAMEAVYQARMAYRAKELGYELDHGANFSMDIRGYSAEYLASESERTAEIEAEKERRGQHGPRADSIIALDTRNAKTNQTPEEIQAAHRINAEEHGNQPAQVISAALEHSRAVSPEFQELAAARAVEYARLRLSERTSVMEWYEVDRDALRLAQGNFTLENVAAAFRQAEERAEFVETKHWRNYAPEHRYTTPELEAKERRILFWMAEGKGHAAPIAGEITRDEFREKFRSHLNDGQKHLVWNLIHSRDRMVGVQGLAGSGKTTCLGVLKGFAEDHGFEVHGVAATGGAANALQGAGIKANTLAGFMREPASSSTAPKLYLLDEASLADVHQMDEFLTHTRAQDRVIVIGDTKQHGSVGAGAVFQELQDGGMETFRLKTIVRQQTKEYREVVRQLAAGEIKEALTALDERAQIHEFEHESLRHKAVAMYLVKDPAHTLVVAPDNRARSAITDKIREERDGLGQLGKVRFECRILEQRSEMQKQDLLHAINYNPGDVLVYGERNALGLRAGERAAVMGIDVDRNILTVLRESDGKVLTYNPASLGTSVAVYEASSREFAQGDRVQFTKNIKREGVANRQLGTIAALGRDGSVKVELDVQNPDGSKRTWSGNLDRMPFLDHGYVMTSYSAQGASIDKVLIHLDTDAPHTARMLTQQLIYVATSRGRYDVHLFTNNLEELTEMLYRLEQSPTALPLQQIKAYAAAEIEKSEGMSYSR